MSEFLLPDLGEGLREAEIVAWHVGEGDHVVVDQPLVSVETEKAVVEIPSPRAGHIARLRASPKERVLVGAPLVDFEDGPHGETGTVVGSLAGPEPMLSAPTMAASTGTVRASPAVRARARELGVDLADIAPGGPGGSVTLSDVEAAKAPQRPQAVKVLGGARRAMALNMIRAGREVVPRNSFRRCRCHTLVIGSRRYGQAAACDRRGLPRRAVAEFKLRYRHARPTGKFQH